MLMETHSPQHILETDLSVDIEPHIAPSAHTNSLKIFTTNKPRNVLKTTQA